MDYINKHIESDENPAEESKQAIEQMQIVQKDEPHLTRFYKEDKSSKSQDHEFYHRSNKDHCLELIHHFSNFHSHDEIP